VREQLLRHQYLLKNILQEKQNNPRGGEMKIKYKLIIMMIAIVVVVADGLTFIKT